MAFCVSKGLPKSVLAFAANRRLNIEPEAANIPSLQPGAHILLKPFK